MTMKAPQGSANVSIDPPRYLVGPSARTSSVTEPPAVQNHLSLLLYVGLPYVEQHPEDKRDDGQVVPDDGERAERRLEALDVERLTVGGRLLDERDRRDRARPHEQHLQPYHGTEPYGQRHREEPYEHASKPGLARLERQVEQFDDLQRDRGQAKHQRDQRRLRPRGLPARLDLLQSGRLD